MPAATKSITLQEDKPSLRVTSSCPRSANFASASDFAFLNASAAWKSIIFMKSQHLSLTRVHPCKPWSNSNFFLGLWIELRFCMRQVMTSMASGKILPPKMNMLFHAKSSTVRNVRPHNSRSTCHSTRPLPERLLLSKRTNRLYESLPHAHAALILRQQTILRFQNDPAVWKSIIFMKC